MNKYLKRVLDFLGIGPSINNTKEVIEQEVKVESNIQEPVISFIKCFKANPKRFEITVLLGKEGRCYTLKDRLIGESFNFDVQINHTTEYEGCGMVSRSRSFIGIEGLPISYDEAELLYTELQPVANRKQAKDRYARIAGSRIEREIKAERERLTNIYK